MSGPESGFGALPDAQGRARGGQGERSDALPATPTNEPESSVLRNPVRRPAQPGLVLMGSKIGSEICAANTDRN